MQQLTETKFWPFDQLLIELHYESVPLTLQLFRGLEQAGYRVFSQEVNHNPGAQGKPPIAVEFGLVKNPSPFAVSQIK
jgi:hypothetical protein